MESTAYAGVNKVLVTKIANSDKVNGIGCTGIDICAITQMSAVNIALITSCFNENFEYFFACKSGV